MAKRVLDPMTGKPLQKGRPVDNAGPSRSEVPDVTKSMPKDRLKYHRNPKVDLAPDNAGNRSMGAVGRAIDPLGGGDGIPSETMRKGRPNNPAYDKSVRGKVKLGLQRGFDTITGMDETIFGKKKKGK